MEREPVEKGTGFAPPPGPHEHWHIDVSYINTAGTFYYPCSVLEGFSRVIVHWDRRPSMTEGDIEIILQAAWEQYPEARPRIISDNGPQFLVRDFKEFIRIAGMTHAQRKCRTILARASTEDRTWPPLIFGSGHSLSHEQTMLQMARSPDRFQ